jgi:hypothetical protein
MENSIESSKAMVGTKELMLSNYYLEDDRFGYQPIIIDWIIEKGEAPNMTHIYQHYERTELLSLFRELYGNIEPYKIGLGRHTDDPDTTIGVSDMYIKINNDLWVKLCSVDLSNENNSKPKGIRNSTGEIITCNDLMVISYFFTTGYKDSVIELFEVIKRIRVEVLPYGENHINILVNKHKTLRLESFEIPSPIIDCDLMYNEGFSVINGLITDALNTPKSKGLIILHGASGTGKTTYIKYLLSNVKKRVIYIPPNIVNAISDPEFLTFLLKYKDSILVIEDAENILTKRDTGNNQSVSNILNLSDGILSDILNIQVICTFNAKIQSIDKALLRKGRLICEYEFKPLEVKRVKSLAKHLGVSDTIIQTLKEQPISDVFNLNKQYHSGINAHNKETIGFKFVS